VSTSDAGDSGLLLLLFNNTNFANIGDATGLQGSATAGSLYVSLHTADPTDVGDQTTNETAYTNYAREAVPRSGAGWTVSGTTPTQAANAAVIDFPQCGATGATVTYFGIGTALSGAGLLLFSGVLGAALAVVNGMTPEFPIGLLAISAD
jgi:hypothetical protein